MPVKPRIKFSPGKTYVYSGSEGVYSVIAGELLEGDAVPSGGNLSYGSGAPGAGSGKDGDVYLDLTDFKIHTKTAGSWGSGTAFKGAAGVKGATLLQGSGSPLVGDGDDGDTFLDVTNHIVYKKSGGIWAAQGSSFKGATGASGSKGADGLRGKVTLEGAGAPGTGSNLATPTAALTSALSDASLTSGDLDVGDLYLDTTNHRFYKKTALGWATRGLSFVGPAGATGLKGDTGDTGPAGTKGDTGASGAGLNKYSSALGTDTYLSTGATASTPTTSANTAYPAFLNLTDVMEDVGSVITRGSYTYDRSATATATGSKFVIDTAGRYKLDCSMTFNVQASSSAANSVDLTASIVYSTNSGTTWTILQTQTATFTTASTTAAQTTLELSKTSWLPAGTWVAFRARRGTSDVNTAVSVNAITKSEVGDDTFVVLTKL